MKDKKNNKDTNEEELLEKEDDLEQEEIMESDLKLKLQKSEEELNSVKSQLTRLQADFVNFRKRSEKEKQDTISYALEGFICSILPILDNFKIAMNSEDNTEDAFYKGIQLIYKQLEDTLDSNGVKSIASLGEEFDPNIHHAVFMEESDEYESGKVTEVLQTGYILKDKVIRPAMVKVAK